MKEIWNIIKNFLIDNSVLLQAISAIVVISGLPILLIRWIRSIPYKPGIELCFDPKETYHQVFEVNSQKDSMWLHVMAKNRKFSDIKNAQGFLSTVWQIKDNKKYRLSLFRAQIKLKWAHENDFEPKDVIKKNQRRLDVCYALNGDTTLYLATEYYPSGTQRTLGPGEYIFLINLTAENLLSKHCLLHIFWDGVYTNIKAGQYKKNFREIIFGMG